jgi:diacylglycerol kinase (ATP)
MGTVLIFANPISGRGRGKAIAEEIAAGLRQADRRARLIFDPPETLKNDDIPSDVVAAVSIGGDGTLRSVAERLLALRNVPPLLVVPLGTANLMARHLKLKYRRRSLAETALELILHHRLVELDAAVANERLFLLMAGVGLDGRIVHELARLRRGPIRFASYALPAALALRANHFPPLTVRVDGRTVSANEGALVFVGNVKEYGIGLPILSDADSADGLLDVCVLPCRSVLDLPKLLMLLLTGDHVVGEGVQYLRGKTIDISADVDVPVQIDGDAAGHTPLQIRVLDRRVPFIVHPS